MFGGRPTRVNIHMSSSSLPSMQRPWRFTHCGGMGELFKKCWITTWSISPLWIIKLYCNKGGQMWKGEHDLLLLGEIVWKYGMGIHKHYGPHFVIGVKSIACKRWCKRWHHHYMGLRRNKMSSMQGKDISGWSHNCVLFTMNWKLHIPYDEWPSNSK
jgi:hypothetical protein